MTQAPAPDDILDLRVPARLNPGVGAVFGLAVALLLAMLPGAGMGGHRLPAGIAASAADQSILGTANRIAETRANVSKARGPRERLDFGDTPLLLAGALTLGLIILIAGSTRALPAPATTPRRRPTTTRARAPPRA